MKSLFTLATTTVRELIRERWVWLIAGLGIFTIFLSLVLSQMSFDEGDRLLADLGLAAADLAAAGLALFAGATLLAREIERQTCLLVLAKPLSRDTFLAGKSAGLAALLAVLLLSQCLFVYLLLGTKPTFAGLAIAGLTLWLKALTLLGFAVWMGALVRPLIGFLFGLALDMFGHWLGDLEFFARKAENPVFLAVAEGARWIVPNFDRFNWKSFVDLESHLGWSDLGGAAIHLGAWAVFYFVMAAVSFRRRDLV